VCTEAIVVALLSPQRTPPEVGYITSPGRAVRALVTDRGVLERVDDDLILTAVPAGAGPIEERINEARSACGWDLAVAPAVAELAGPTPDELRALRTWDPQGWFLRVR